MGGDFNEGRNGLGGSMNCNHNIPKDRWVESCPACFGEWHANEFMLEKRVKELEATLISMNCNCKVVYGNIPDFFVCPHGNRVASVSTESLIKERDDLKAKLERTKEHHQRQRQENDETEQAVFNEQQEGIENLKKENDILYTDRNLYCKLADERIAEVHRLRAALAAIEKELGEPPTNFINTGDYYYQNASAKISTAIGIIRETLNRKEYEIGNCGDPMCQGNCVLGVKEDKS